MPVVEVELTVKQDGNLVSGFPLISHRFQGELNVRRIIKPHGDAPGVYYILSTLGIANVVAIQTDVAVNIRLNNQSNATIPLNDGGILFLADVNINAGANVNILVNNTDPTRDAHLTIIEAGP